MSDKIQCVKVQVYEGSESYIATRDEIFRTLADELDALDDGDYLMLTPIELTKAEIDALPEFKGF